MVFIRDFFNAFRIVDIIDVAIIATFIYMALVWFEKARARFVMIGLFTLGSIYVLARLFGLYLTTLVFQAFFAIFLIMIVVIFQDEFRQFFERIALWRIVRKRKRFTSVNQNVEILTNTLADFARKKIGALIVLKGQDPLDRQIEGGVPLKGLLNQVTLESLFDPHTPSHDGAVVIEENQIVKFGVHLPLSVNIHGAGHLGTRHAAALGLSERTDAVCLVVSEEHGTIFIADGDKIRQLKDIANLRLRLEDFYRKRFPPQRKFWQDLLAGHILEKVIAVVLAGGLWFLFGQRQEIIRRDFVIPIEYRNLAADWIIAEPSPKEATVSLSGTERVFDLSNPKEFKISLDMSQVRHGENEFLLTEELVRRPSGLSVVSITPRKITLNIYKLLTLSLPVKVETNGRAPFGVKIKEIKVAPQTVSVIVPSIMPQEELTIKTEPINLKEIRQTQTLTPKLILPKGARFANDKLPEVKVIIEVEE